MRTVSDFRHLVIGLMLLLLVPLQVHAKIEEYSPPTTVKNSREQLESLLSAPLKNQSDDLVEAIRLYQGAGVIQDRPKAYRYFISAAEQGNSAAQYVVGCMYRVGEGVSRSPVKATRWFEKAAEKGNVEAMFTLGVMYDLTLEMPADREK